MSATLFSECPVDAAVFDAIPKISAGRNAVSGGADGGQDLGTENEADLVPTDDYGRGYGRSAAAILNIVYLDPNAGSAGGFYPDGLNGNIVNGIGQRG